MLFIFRYARAQYFVVNKQSEIEYEVSCRQFLNFVYALLRKLVTMLLTVKLLFHFILFVIISKNNAAGVQKDGSKPDWAKKDIRDYNDVDLEKLYDQWEEDDEPLEPDELPEHLRPAPKMDFSNIGKANPEDLLKMSKKGRSLMAFVSVSGNPTPQETEEVTKLWQSSLMNSHINVERYPIGDNRVIFMFKDGSQAWDAKDFLIKQEKLDVVTIENKEYYGKYSSKPEEKDIPNRKNEL